MKYFTKAFIFLTAVLAFFSCSGGNIGGECNRQKTEKAASLRIVNWNVQTFFDAQCDGNEYSEFIKSRRWGEEPYKERLRRLCSVIRELDADVFVMEELESASVMHDISNFLAGEWNVKSSIFTDAMQRMKEVQSAAVFFRGFRLKICAFTIWMCVLKVKKCPG